jgi:hypothetical protein
MPEPSTSLPVVTAAMPVPVYDCRVYVSGPDAEGFLHGRVANLPGISAKARGERDLLTQLVRDFKWQLVERRSQGESVALVDPVPPPEPGERQRWIPVHL